MGVPRIIRRVEAAKKDEKRSTTRVAPSIAKPKKKRSDKLRALAGAFGAEASEGSASPTEGLAAKYDVYEKVGQGKQGVMVFRCTERSTGKPYAVKRVPKTLLGTTHGDERPMVAALRGCTQLVETHEVIESPDSLDYVMELANGGDLFEWIATRGALCEDRARPLFLGILNGLRQVHASGLIHRDVKLENVLLMHPDPSTADQVRLADFEFCTPSPAMGAVGSVAFAAPEALGEGPYTAAVDVWAAGVCLYAMLSASAPFDAPEGIDATARRILDAKPGMAFPEECWDSISHQAKDLINGMLHPDVQQRLNLDQIIAHPWLKGSASMLSAPAISIASAAPVSMTSEPRPSKSPKLSGSPKFALKLGWHSKMRRWSSKGSKVGCKPGLPTITAADVAMLIDDDSTQAAPVINCPLEWAPRARSMSM